MADLGPGLPPVDGRGFRAYATAAVAGWAGVAAADVLFLWLAFTQTHSDLAVAYVGMAEALPVMALGLPAGVLADRYNRRTVLVAASVLQAGSVLLVPLSLAWWGFHLSVLLGLVAALEVGTIIWYTASNAVIPSLVRPDRLESANGIVQAATSVSSAVGAAVGSLLLGLGPAWVPAALTVLLFVAAGGLFWGIPATATALAPAPHEAAAPPRRLREDLRELVVYLRQHPAIAELTAVSLGAGFFIQMCSPFFVVFVVDALRAPASEFGYLVAAYTAGFFVGSLAVGRAAIAPRFGRFQALSLSLDGLLLVAVVVFAWFPLAIAGFAVIGSLFGLAVTGFGIVLQRLLPVGLLGRYHGLDQTLAMALAPLGILTGGLLIESYGVRAAFALAALGLAACGLLSLARPRIRALGAPPPQPEEVSVPAGAIGPVEVPALRPGLR